MLTVHIAHLLSYYLLIQLYLPLVKIGNLYLNLGWMRYVIMHRHKYFCYYLFNIKKRDLPKRTGPFYLYQSDITLRQLPVRRLTDADYQYITEIWETFGKHYEHELHILHPISSKYPTIFATSTTFRYFNC